MANPNPPKPPSIYEIGLKNHLDPIHPKLYEELVELDSAKVDNAAIARVLKKRGITKEEVSRITIAKWRKVLHHETKKKGE